MSMGILGRHWGGGTTTPRARTMLAFAYPHRKLATHFLSPQLEGMAEISATCHEGWPCPWAWLMASFRHQQERCYQTN